jgi:hypothetical protein
MAEPPLLHAVERPTSTKDFHGIRHFRKRSSASVTIADALRFPGVGVPSFWPLGRLRAGRFPAKSILYKPRQKQP